MLNKNITYTDKKRKQGSVNNTKGHLAESVACFWLICKGYKILSRNFSCGKGTGRGEIDIIAFKKDTVVFAEVKYRHHFEKTAYAISLSNKKRTTAAAEHFIATHPDLKNYGVRFDAVLFGRFAFPQHIKDAWRPKWW